MARGVLDDVAEVGAATAVAFVSIGVPAMLRVKPRYLGIQQPDNGEANNVLGLARV